MFELAFFVFTVILHAPGFALLAFCRWVHTQYPVASVDAQKGALKDAVVEGVIDAVMATTPTPTCKW